MAKNSRRNRRSLEVPDGYASAEDSQEFLERQTQSIEVSIPPENSKPVPPSAAEVHAGPEIGNAEGEKEIKLPKYFFERSLSDAIRSSYAGIREGFALIREINSEKKHLELSESDDEAKLGFLAERVKSVDPGDKKILAEIDRLKSLEAEEYDVAGFKSKMDSYPEIVALKNSDKPESEKQKEYEEFIKGRLQHEVREIFRQNKIAGQAAKMALYVQHNIRKSFLRLVDRKKEEKTTFMYRGVPTAETAERKPLTPESEKEKLAEVEAKIESEFSKAEKEFKSLAVKKYTDELQAAKNKIEKGGGVADGEWASVFRQSFIDSWKRFGIQKDKWGANGPLAPEKADLLEKYLFLKLPVGIPEEKPINEPIKKESVYSGERSKEFLRLMRVGSKFFRKWLKESEQWGPEFGDEETKKNAILEQLQVALTGFMTKDSELKKHFAENDIPNAVERATNYIKQFNNIEITI